MKNITFAQMDNIIHIVARFDVGGAESVAVNIAKSKNGNFDYHLVEVIRGRSRFTQSFVDNCKEAHITTHRSLIPVFISFHYLFEKLAACLFPFWFIFLFLRYKPIVIHCHTEIPEFAVWMFYKLFPWVRRRCKVVRTIHNTVLWTGMNFVGSRVENFMQIYEANVAISKSVRDSYHKNFGSWPPLIYNGVPQIKENKRYTGILQGKINILFAGRFEKQKGISHLVNIVTALKEDTRYHFHILGSGTLQAEVDALKTYPNVTISPPLYGIASYMSSFHYLLMPSLHEGLGILSIEASMQGLPVIASDCPGLIETLPADWHLLVRGNQLGEYLRVFREVLPYVERKKLVQEAREFVIQYFSIERMQACYEDMYIALGK